MIPAEVLKRVRLIEITTRKVVNDVMTGRYRSHFKGQGVQFSEHRQYVPGDDIRHIDWKVSARSRDPLIKKYEEERELSVLLVVDVSRSGQFGSWDRFKAEIAGELAGVLAHAATHTGDKVGLILFAGEIEHVLQPRKGRTHVQRIIRDIIGHETRTSGTDLASALESARRVLKHSGVVFVISDFMASGYELALKRLSRRHDVVALRISDERERSVPDVGLLWLHDPETGEETVVDTASYAFRSWLEDSVKAREAEWKKTIQSGRTEEIRIGTREDYFEALVKFFRARGRPRGRIA